MVCLRNICVDTLYKGDTKDYDDDDDDDNNNNNNNNNNNKKETVDKMSDQRNGSVKRFEKLRTS